MLTYSHPILECSPLTIRQETKKNSKRAIKDELWQRLHRTLIANCAKHQNKALLQTEPPESRDLDNCKPYVNHKVSN